MHPTSRHPADVHDWLVVHDPLAVGALIDRIVDTTGVDARSAYVETYRLALLGPSCVLAALMALTEIPQGRSLKFRS